MKVERLSLISLFSLLLIVGCGRANVDTQVTDVPEPSSPQPAATHTATHTATPSTTSTTRPSPTVPATATPTPLPMGVVNVNEIEVRYGPGMDYPILIHYFDAQGIVLPVVGQSEDGQWLVVDLGFGQVGWVEMVNLSYDFDPSSLAFFAAPPTPTPPPPQTPGPSIIVKYVPTYSEPKQGKYVVDIYLSGFQRQEYVKIRVVDLATGEITRAFGVYYYTPEKGIFRVRISGISSGDQLLFTASGNEGTYAETTFYVP